MIHQSLLEILENLSGDNIHLMTELQTNFIKLPNDLLSLLLTVWLDWKEVARYDAAMCNKAGRPEWLALVKEACVFSSISFGYPNSFHNLKWLTSRFVRIKKIEVGTSNIPDVSAMEGWLQKVGPDVESIKTTRDADFTLQYFERFCHRLTSFATYSYGGEVGWWDVLRVNANLVELHLWGESLAVDITIPTHLSLPSLRKLSIDCDTLTHENAVPLLTQLPGLRSLQIVSTRCPSLTSVVRVYDCLPARLVHLDLRYAFDVNGNDSDNFVTLLRSLTLGLHTLIVPSTLTLSEHDLHSIVQYHGHSLRCLSIPNNAGCDLVDCLNALTLLHTLEVSSQCLRFWKRGLIANPSLQHLLIDSCYVHGYDILDSLCDHCPWLTTLSLCRFEAGGSFLPFLRLITHRERLRTICTDNVDTMAQLKLVAPKVNVLNFTSLDIFKFDY